MKFVSKILHLALVWLALAGCGSPGDTRAPAIQSFNEARSGLQLPLRRNLTPFAEGLRCMDGLLQRHAVRMSLLVEEIGDKTTKAPAGTTEMVLAAMSQMTQRSGATVRTVAFGADLRNITELMHRSGSRTAYRPENLPAFAVRGAVSQYDENLARATSDSGVSLGPIGRRLSLGGGAAKSTSVNLIALDLSLVDTRDFSLVPGASVHNVAAIVQDGSGVDAEVSYHKRMGVNFGHSLAKSDGRTVAQRNLVELSMIQLVGSKTRLPYWRCLGLPDDHPDVQQQVDDWVAVMSTADKLRFLVTHFRLAGLLPAEGEADPALFRMAFRSYAEVLDVDPEQISPQLMRAHFSTDAWAAAERAGALLEARKRELPAIDIAFAPPAAKTGGGYSLTLNRPAYVQCFWAPASGRGFRHLVPGPAAQVMPAPAGRPFGLRELKASVALRLPPHATTLACMASKENRAGEIAKRWAQLIRSQRHPTFTTVKALHRQLAAEGDYVAISVLGPDQARTER